MDIHKITHEVLEATKHYHLPIWMGLIGYIKLKPKINLNEENSGLGDVPGDNILPSKILFSILSRRSL